MSWISQGYYSDYDPVNKESMLPAWIVYTNGVEDEEIEAYDGKTVKLDGWESKTKIVYGTSNSRFFKGFIETNDLQIVSSILQRFAGFPVYENKFGGKKEFELATLNFFIYHGISLFVENASITDNELAELIQDLKSWILPKNIPHELLRKIEEDLKEKYMTAANSAKASNSSMPHS
jgi:hypothetical protein